MPIVSCRVKIVEGAPSTNEIVAFLGDHQIPEVLAYNAHNVHNVARKSYVLKIQKCLKYLFISQNWLVANRGMRVKK